jgi:hypothetical protein
MTISIPIALTVGLACAAAVAVAADPAPTWPAGTTDKKDPKVLAFYDRQCTSWADSNGLAGDARDAYLAKCRANAPKVYPVGYGPPAEGGGE